MNDSSSFCGGLLAGMRARGQGQTTPAPTPVGLGQALAEDPQRGDGVVARASHATPLPLLPVNLTLADYVWDSQRRTPAAPLKPAAPASSQPPASQPPSAAVLRNLYARELQSAEAAADAAFGRGPQAAAAVGSGASKPAPEHAKDRIYGNAAAKGAGSPWAAAAAAAAPVEE